MNYTLEIYCNTNRKNTEHKENLPGLLFFSRAIYPHPLIIMMTVFFPVHHADVYFHAGLARSDCFQRFACVCLLQHLDYLPKHYCPGGSESVPGPTPIR